MYERMVTHWQHLTKISAFTITTLNPPPYLHTQTGEHATQNPPPHTNKQTKQANRICYKPQTFTATPSTTKDNHYKIILHSGRDLSRSLCCTSQLTFHHRFGARLNTSFHIHCHLTRTEALLSDVTNGRNLREWQGIEDILETHNEKAKNRLCQ